MAHSHTTSSVSYPSSPKPVHRRDSALAGAKDARSVSAPNEEHNTTDPRSPKASRPVIVKPDTYATFTSVNANTHQPTPYMPSFPPSLRLTKHAVHIDSSNEAILTITRNAVHMPEPFSSKPLLNLLDSRTGRAVGSIRFHSLTTSAVDLELDRGGKSRMEHAGALFNASSRWRFVSFSQRTGDRAERVLFWCRDKEGWELREGTKKGTIIARMNVPAQAHSGPLLRFEKALMEDREVMGVALSAAAVCEAHRRSKREHDWGVEAG